MVRMYSFVLYASLVSMPVGAQQSQASGSLPATPAAQSQPAPEPAGTTATAPEQFRRVLPPNLNASAAELEQQADALRGQKAYADALDYYAASLKKHRSAVVHNKMGMTELMMLRYDEAKRDFEKSTKLDPDYADGYNNLGVVYYIRRSYGKAVKNYSKALELREKSASFHSNLGTAFFARKEFDKASQQYTRALELDPEVFEHRGAAGVSAHMMSTGDRAHFDYVIAKMYAGRGDLDHAIQYLRKSMEEGYANFSGVFTDEAFTGLRKDPRFSAMVENRPAPLPN